MNGTSIGIAVLMLAVAVPAAADDSGLYVGAGIALVDMPKQIGLGVSNVPLLRGDADNQDTGFAVTLGYRVNRNISFELGYVDLGDLEANVVDVAGTSDARATVGFSSDGMTFAMIGTFPIGKWEPYVKAGILFSSTMLEYSGTLSSTTFSARIADDDEDALYGAGVRYALRDRLRVYLDATLFSEVGEPRTGQLDAFSTSLGALWRF